MKSFYRAYLAYEIRVIRGEMGGDAGRKLTGLKCVSPFLPVSGICSFGLE